VTRPVWLASYPKAGSTWFRLLVANLSAADGEPVDINRWPVNGGVASARAPFENLLLIDSGLLTHDETDSLRPRLYEALSGTEELEDTAQGPRPARFVKVHDAYALTAQREPLLAGRRAAAGVILIVRDPRDIAVSLAHHSRNSIDEAISFMNNSEAGYCMETDRQRSQLRQRLLDWSGHAVSWLEQSDLPLLLVRYEDLQADTFATFRRALDFADYAVGDDLIRRAIGHADFAELQRQEQSRGFREAPRQPGSLFFRRGTAGAWRDELTIAQVGRIEAAHASMMRRLGYELAGASIAQMG
jgi:hypothetical protein